MSEEWKLAHRTPEVVAGLRALKDEIIKRRKDNDPLRPPDGWLSSLETWRGYMTEADWAEIRATCGSEGSSGRLTSFGD